MRRSPAIAILILALVLAPVAVAGAADAQRELRPFDAHSLAAIRKTYAGRPFVLAFWSIHCEPCREEMAQWKHLKQRHPALPIVLVATDTPAERTSVVAFLARYDPGPVETWMFADEFSERVRYAVDRSWRGELPRTYLFDAGHRYEARSGRYDPRWLEDWLAKQRKAGAAQPSAAGR